MPLLLLGLPTELLEHIIALLHKPSLSALSLTCRALCPLARAPLLASARVRRPAQAVALLTLAERAPRFAALVTRLALAYASPLAPQLLARLPALRALSLRGAAPTAGHDGLESLALRACTFASAAHLRACVARFPALRALKLRSVRARAAGTGLEQPAPLPPGLRELTLSHADVGAFRTWAPAGAITLAVALHGRPADDAACAALVGALAPHLGSLRMKLPSVWSPDPDPTADPDAPPLADLGGAPALAHLELTNVAPAHVAAAARLLGTCVPGALRTLRLELLDLDAALLLPDDAAWAALDGALADSRFAALERVALAADAPLCASTLDALAGALPRLEARRACTWAP
jgi:hypothetical protein